ncbi:crosslink repair DNA glycosylase YcaQ family protein [Gordonia sp. ABSL1-1]|uniref:winged helix-turn-helix domain-containing protein n=1 Tax=Gordonia sp. ABSL1-1 TaxID=3053923 RepID=UPI002572EBA2|nr:crosslink repair DNA glycosylase YcaQ family protein [Gordonia sp. ABSL1-1]MDL9936331.1 crosslink repair DNA glycosylase YcaQ family protein [Gordonia sp. ABSL1-1]
MTPQRISSAAARRIALAAQGFADRAPAATPTRAHLRRVVGRTNLIQMDSVNIVARAHYLPMFSRIGSYDPAILERAAAGGNRLLVEYWAHEAALIPIDDWPLFGWRMQDFADGRYRYTREVMANNRQLAADVTAVIAEHGPSMPRDIEAALGIERAPGVAGGWWNRGEVKHVCEAMFASGELSAVRDNGFRRYYDLTERVVGAERVGAKPDRATAHRELTARAASALGVATVADLADYYRLKAAEVRPAVADLVDDGVLDEVSVDGWKDPAYLHREARTPRRVAGSAILSPFDPLIFFRPRVERLFDFHYRIEIYVPAHKRVHGYYVLPYLFDESIVARVDLKADRKAGVLQVLSAHREDGHDDSEVAARLAVDLAELASWCGLDSVSVNRRGALSGALRGAVAELDR